MTFKHGGEQFIAVACGGNFQLSYPARRRGPGLRASEARRSKPLDDSARPVGFRSIGIPAGRLRFESDGRHSVVSGWPWGRGSSRRTRLGPGQDPDPSLDRARTGPTGGAWDTEARPPMWRGSWPARHWARPPSRAADSAQALRVADRSSWAGSGRGFRFPYGANVYASRISDFYWWENHRPVADLVRVLGGERQLTGPKYRYPRRSAVRSSLVQASVPKFELSLAVILTSRETHL